MIEQSEHGTLETILIVDDTPDNIALLSSLLKGLYRTKVATHGDKALEIAFSEEPPDLILLDIMMPGMDGYEVCRRIKEKNEIKNIPIIFISSLDETLDKVKAFNAGGIDYITKPFQLAEVRARLETHLKIQRLQRELEARNRDLNQNLEQLRKLGKQKDEFVRIASHDLRNPLMCILGFTSLMKNNRSGIAMTDEMIQYLERIHQNARTMKSVINDFLDFHAMEDGEIKFANEVVDLNALAQKIVDQNEGRATGKEIVLESDLCADLPGIQADGARISQVMDNLLGNAIKFSDHARVEIRTRHEDGYVFFEVTDSGPGLNADDMKMLFVKYAKLSNKPTGGENSSGLGLSICKKLIEMQGGKIGARNNSERGATFWFKFLADVRDRPSSIQQNVESLFDTK